MSLFGTLGTGASGLSASSTNLSVIGDNIANVGTTGYKSSRAYFGDVFPEFLGSASGPSPLGRGAMLQGIGTQFEQGALESTGGTLDMAIAGQGFLSVKRGDQTYYTRDGAMQLDKDGYLVNLTGGRIQGYQGTDGVLSSRVGDVQFDLGALAHKATTELVLDLSLASTDASDGIDYAALTLDGTVAGATLTDASDAADMSTSMTVFDSMGAEHQVAINFESTGSNGWTWSAVVDGSEVDLDGDGVGDGTPGGAYEIANGTLSFDTSGVATGFTVNQTSGTTAWNFVGAAAADLNFDFGLDAAGAATKGGAVMTGTESFVNSLTQDGNASADLVDLSVGGDGVVQGIYSNGQQRALGGVAIASFSAEQGLERVGGNLFSATWESGEAALGTPGVGGRGSIASQSLERSSTNLESEFIGLIQAQRSYQANAGVIRTANDTLQALVNLV